jgi:hypothetical protein
MPPSRQMMAAAARTPVAAGSTARRRRSTSSGYVAWGGWFGGGQGVQGEGVCAVGCVGGLARGEAAQPARTIVANMPALAPAVSRAGMDSFPSLSARCLRVKGPIQAPIGADWSRLQGLPHPRASQGGSRLRGSGGPHPTPPHPTPPHIRRHSRLEELVGAELGSAVGQHAHHLRFTAASSACASAHGPRRPRKQHLALARAAPAAVAASCWSCCAAAAAPRGHLGGVRCFWRVQRGGGGGGGAPAAGCPSTGPGRPPGRPARTAT